MKKNKITQKKKPSKRLIKALKEIKKIESGKIKAKKYNSIEDVINEI